MGAMSQTNPSVAMSTPRLASKRLLPPAATPLSSVFSDKIARSHPLGNLVAIASALSGMALILAFGF